MSNNLSLASSQRVDFTSLFTAEGYEIDSIIGTTYSLNYETLLMLILAVTYGPGADKALEHKSEDISPAAIFAAIKQMRGKLKVYCQADKTEELHGTNNNENMQRIKVLLDEFVEPVPMTKGENGFSSFHSKVWLISFKKQYHKYRMIVTSRNLTSNRDFDAVAVFEHGGNSKACVKEILKQIAPPQEVEDQFKNICFEPEPQKITADEIENCHSVVSPFLDAELLTKIPGRLNIFSLRSEIDKVWKADQKLTEKHNFYCFNPALEIETDEGQHSSIHAKLYISDDFIILGSSNFTTRGWQSNREFNVKLSSGIDEQRLKEEFGVDKEEKYGSGMFVPYQSPKSEDTIKDEAKDMILQELARIQLTAEWKQDEKKLCLSAEYPDGVNSDNFEWKPLLAKKEWQKGKALCWTMDAADASKIFLCRIKVTENGLETEKVIQMLAVWKNEPEGLWEERCNAERSKLSLADELDFRMLYIETDKLYGRDVPLKRNRSSDNSHCPPRPPVFERLLKADKEQLEKFFAEEIIKRDDEDDPLGLVQAFGDLRNFFGIKPSGGKK